MHPNPDEIARVTDYIVAYACKGNESIVWGGNAFYLHIYLTVYKDSLCHNEHLWCIVCKIQHVWGLLVAYASMLL